MGNEAKTIAKLKTTREKYRISVTYQTLKISKTSLTECYCTELLKSKKSSQQIGISKICMHEFKFSYKGHRQLQLQ